MLRRVALVLGVVVLAAAAFFLDAGEATGPLDVHRVEAREHAGGLEVVDVTLTRGGAPGGRVVALYFSSRSITPRLLLNDGAEDLAELAPGALAVVNAGFFTPERRPTGLLVSEGKTLSPFVREGGGAGSGVFILEGHVPTLLPRDQVKKRSFERTTLAIQAGPRVIEPGGTDGIRSDDGQRANRTVIGRDRAGRVAIAVVLGPKSWATGPTLFELQRILGKRGLGRLAPELAFEEALNLDGGPSTGLDLRLPSRPVRASESAPVHSVLALEGAR
ncbi:phosphodiester glycosidase family protein [Myxococcota bacterium]|nr:phosphodiester glycosidase family protein [Myxococcota bacterium]